ncbi:MAG: type II toxin-antitoxin system PrlF family antitoxin [Betaproteobacteria bacterium]|nr:type II toxin-antitoxin system PrlF family antitoxin [Betaproteobacteria bacterium]
MRAVLEAESTLTDRYQTTVPEAVRRALRLTKRDRIHYSIRPGGEVVLTRTAQDEEADQALGAFLEFLVRDITEHPEHIQPMSAKTMQGVQSLVEGVEVDLDAALSADDE